MEHTPVMLKEVLEQLTIKKDGIYLDCTFGRGGHSLGILNSLGENGRLLAFDRDSEAVSSDNAQILLKDERFILKHCCFSELESVISNEGLTGKIDGVLLDLGVSSPQFDNPERGFSFLHEGCLDMRMDNTAGISAGQWLATVTETELVRVLFEYGEERFSRRIAKAIIDTRAKSPIITTRQLAGLIEDAVPIKDKYKHPATRSFQAIRIEINQELDELKAVLQQAIKVLATEGRLVVISFHSLEDRIVKRFIRAESGTKHYPEKFPIKNSEMLKGILQKMPKAITASHEEIAQNPRSRSAIMRVAKRI